MKRFVAVIAILKNGLFLKWTRIQNVGGERVRADAHSHCEHMGERRHQENETCTTSAVC